MSSPSWLTSASKILKTNSPAILSGAAIAGLVGTVVLAVKATPQVTKAVEEYELYQEEKLSVRRKITLTWKIWLPSALTGTATIACIAGSNAIGTRRTAATYAAYALVDTTFREYKDRVLAEITPAKALKIEDGIQKKRLEDTPPSSTQVIITGTGDQLCYDPLTGRYFRSDVEKIRQAANKVNQTVLRDMYASHDEFYEQLGLRSTMLGTKMGWNIDTLLEIDFTSHLSEDNTPCLAIKYKNLPRLDFDRL